VSFADAALTFGSLYELGMYRQADVHIGSISKLNIICQVFE